VAIWQHRKRFLGIFLPACAETAIKELPVKNLIPHSLRQPRFPIRQMHLHYRVTFTGYIRCCCATTSHDLVTSTFDLLTSRVFLVQCFSCATHVLIIIILRLSVIELRYWISDQFPLSETITAHAPFHVTSHRGKNSPHFWNPWPQFAYSLCHSQGATKKMKPCYRPKIAFSHYEGHKVYCACAVSRDLWRGAPQNHT